MPQMQDDSVPVVVVGRGPAGLTAAIALATGGIPTVLAGKSSNTSDNRTTALLAGSVTALEVLGVWNLCAPQAAALKIMRIVDDTGRLWRAPEIKFRADEIGLDAFGSNIENRHLIHALEQCAHSLSGLQIIDDETVSIAPQEHAATVKLGGGKILHASLVIGADGRHSISRAAAGIETDKRSYPQVALTVCLRHSRPHDDTSTEFHTPTGPFTLVPLPGKRSSLVWVLDPPTARAVATFDDTKLAAEIERASHSILGKVEVEPGRGMFPLQIATARQFANKRIALIGEAAHTIPPIGAQGLNLGLRDAATISELAIIAHRRSQDLGSAHVLARYDKMRRADVGSRTLTVDLLNRTLLSDFLPVQGMRGLGLYMMDRIGPLRRAVMREGVGPGSGQPRLMRGEAL